MQWVCDTPMCGFCYEEKLLTDKYVPHKPFEKIYTWMFRDSAAKPMRSKDEPQEELK